MSLSAGASSDPLDSMQFGEVVTGALELGASECRPGAHLQTGALLDALARVDVHGNWTRIWLHTGLPESLHLVDAQDEFVGARFQVERMEWANVPFSAGLTEAFMVLRRLAITNSMSVILPGALALSLVANPTFGATRALLAGSGFDHAQLLDLVQTELLGTTLKGIEGVTAEEISHSQSSSAQEDSLNNWERSAQETSSVTPRNKQSRHPVLGRAQIAGGYLLITIGVIISFLGFSEIRPATHKEIWIYFLGIALEFIATFVLFFATKLLRRGRQRLARVLPLDVVPAGNYVLYLRAFIDDSNFTAVKVAVRERGGVPFVVPVPRTEEEQIREAVLPFGPLIAVGRPGEPLPALGAERGYLNHDMWKRTVLAMMQDARLVLLSAGFSKGLYWELTRAIAHVPPERLVLIIPMKKHEYEEFRKQLPHCFPKGLPAYPEGATIEYLEKIRGVIYFTRNWYPIFVRFDLKTSRGNKVRVIESHFVYGLQPVYQRLDAPWPGVPSPPLIPTKLQDYFPEKYWPLRKQLPGYYLSMVAFYLITLGFIATIIILIVAIV